MNARGNKTGDVRHVNHQISADRIGNLSELCEIDDSGICGSARNDHLGLAFLGGFENLVVIDTVGNAVNAVGYEVEVLTRDVYG